eukprot:TRINITY_DN11148_c0_g1_i6.p1 TRINITY_DN11148_c0_g1~~TRINITY_DN11148_c0_g1_i6.p1  ORF type:complete len:195 (-),score=-11.70 TRINITY_DN11148_c0_g1_i6:155-739(-)
MNKKFNHLMLVLLKINPQLFKNLFQIYQTGKKNMNSTFITIFFIKRQPLYQECWIKTSCQKKMPVIALNPQFILKFISNLSNCKKKGSVYLSQFYIHHNYICQTTTTLQSMLDKNLLLKSTCYRAQSSIYFKIIKLQPQKKPQSKFITISYLYFYSQMLTIFSSLLVKNLLLNILGIYNQKNYIDQQIQTQQIN